MKTFIRTLALCAVIGSVVPAKADVTVGVDAGATWLGYMNVFDLPADGGAYRFGSSWGTADLRATFNGNVLTLSPNIIGDPATYWYIGGGAPGSPGNKIMEANFYVEPPAGTLAGQEVTFTGTVQTHTLTSAHTCYAYIKDFAPDYSSFTETRVLLTGGAFNISLTTDSDPLRHVQYGFQTVGVNVWSTDVAPFGSVTLAAIPLVQGNPDVTVDPTAAWKGYMNVFSHPDEGGGLLSGYDQPITAELRASFSGNVLTFSPFTINPDPWGLDDTDWYREDGSGNRIMEANMYVQPGDGTLSGQTVKFTGTVSSNTLTSGHTAIAFIKEFAPDYLSFNVSSVPLAPGPFSVSLAISNDPTRHVQYGFQMIGPNVWPDYAGPFGAVQISNAVATPYATWIAGFNFSSFTNPDLTPSGDPDGDGRNNLEEFALNGNPSSGAASGKLRSRIESVSGGQAFVLTLPVRGTPAFTGTPSKTASADQVSYTVEGSNGLAVFDQGVTEVSPASADGLPVLDSGWSYRSFRLDGLIGGSSPRGPAGFLRVVISEAP